METHTFRNEEPELWRYSLNNLQAYLLQNGIDIKVDLTEHCGEK